MTAQSDPPWMVEDDSDIPSNPSRRPDFYSVMEARVSRRGFLATAGGSALCGLLPGRLRADDAPGPAQTQTQAPVGLSFEEVPHGMDETLHVPRGYSAQVLLRWGDPLFPGLPAFDPAHQSAADQLRRFGYNNDFVAFLPLPRGGEASDHGLLSVNHEYTVEKMMFPGSPGNKRLSAEQRAIERAAHGLSVVEIKRDAGAWEVVLDSPRNRRITPDTPMRFSGPAAGSPRLATSYSAGGTRTLGTVANCAGGTTPWGTVLTAEENFQGYFRGDPDATPERAEYQRYGINGGDGARYHWGLDDPRWDLDHEPLAANHYGWMVEVDPYDPDSVPIKRTALGRFRHEGCGVVVNDSGHVVAYSGDDQRFEYVYRFVSRDRYVAENGTANGALLDDGVLSVAEFHDDGSLVWHPLVHGQGPLTADNGFSSQADVVIEARRAADLLGATPMDRPEEVEVNPVTGSVFVMLTNNTLRNPWQVDAANPRAFNRFGHIVEIKPDGGDHTAVTARWDFFILAGDPGSPTAGARYHPGISEHGWFIAPDNCCFDNQGRLWIATDGGYKFGIADGVWACEVDGERRALTRHFLRTPLQAELCGPFFTPDDRSFFCAVQHPGGNSSFDAPSTRWPDFDPALPPRPSVVVVTHDRGFRVGS